MLNVMPSRLRFLVAQTAGDCRHGMNTSAVLHHCEISLGRGCLQQQTRASHAKIPKSLEDHLVALAGADAVAKQIRDVLRARVHCHHPLRQPHLKESATKTPTFYGRSE